MEGNHSKTIWGSLKRALAYYPLTLYFGLLLVGLSGLFFWLNLSYGLTLNVESVISWVKTHQTPLLLVCTLILGTTLIGSAVAYRQVANLSREDYLIWLQQRSTRTFFPFFVPFHDWLRLRFAIYRWWHTQVFSSTIHVIILLFALVFSLSAIGGQTKEGLILLSPNPNCAGGEVYKGWQYAFGLVSPAYAAGDVNSFTVTGITTPTTAGATHSVTVTAKDCDNLTKTDYTGTIHFVSSDGAASLPSNYTFTLGDAGVHTFTNEVIFRTVGTQSVTVNDTVVTEVTGNQSGITVNPGTAATFTVSGITDPVTAGTASNVTVTAKDAYNNTATGYTGTVTFTSTDSAATLPTNYAFTGGDAGTHTFTNGVTMRTAGERSVTATDTVTSSITGAQNDITVNPSTATTFTVSGITDPVISGTASDVVVTAKDAYNNTATGYTGTVAFTSSDSSATLPSNYIFTGGDAGTHTFSSGVTMRTVGEQSVTATDTVTSSITGSQSNITVTSTNQSVASFTVTGIADPITAGTPSNVTVTAKNAQGNTLTSYLGTISFSSTDSRAALPSNYTFVGSDAGSHTFSLGVTLKTVGEQTVTATDTGSGVAGSQNNITVTAGAIARLAISAHTPQRVNVGWTETITIYDEYDNLVPLDVNSRATANVASTGSAKLYTSPTYSTLTGQYRLIANPTTIYVKDSVAETIRLFAEGVANNRFTSSPIVVTGSSGTVTEPPSDECEPGGSGGSGSGSTTGSTSEFCAGGGVSTNITTPNQPISQLVVSPTITALNLINAILAVVAPIATLATLAPVSSAIVTASTSGGSVSSYLLFGLVPSRRRKRWGIVKDAKTGLPIGGLFLTLHNEKGRQIARTMTDHGGRYGFLVAKPGDYYIAVVSPLYEPYRSRLLAIVQPSTDIITANILLTPLTIEMTHRMRRTQVLMNLIKVLEIIHWPALIIGSLVAAYAYSQEVTLTNALFLSLYALLWASKALEFDYQRPYGTVVDKSTGMVQAGAVVQLTADHKGEKTVVHSTITDNRGRFLFVVKPFRYQIVAAKEGYLPSEKELYGENINLTLKLERKR